MAAQAVTATERKTDGGRALSLSTKLTYATGSFAESVKVRAFETFLFFYYVQVLELSGTLAGLAVGIALCFDAVTDPFMGSFSDGFQSRWGRRHPFMFLSMLPLPVAFIFLFLPPAGMGQAGTCAWMTVFAVLVRASLTLFHVPHMSLGAELSKDYYERTQIVALRSLMGILGAAVVIGMGFFYFFKATPEFPNGQMNAARYPPFAIACAMGMVVSIALCVVGTRKEIAHLPPAPAQVERFSLVRVYRETWHALRIPSFRALFVGIVLIAVVGGGHATLGLHMGTYFWGLTPAQNGLFAFAYVAGALLGVPLTGPLHRRFDKPATLLWTYGGALGLTVVVLTARLLHLLPENGDPRLLAFIFPFAACVMCVTVAGGITTSSMMADVTDEHELRTGLRQEGIFFGAISLSGKAASAFGHWAAGLALDVIRWPKGADVGPGDVPPEVVWMLGYIYGPILVLFGLAALFAFRDYDLTRERHATIRRELDRRQQAL